MAIDDPAAPPLGRRARNKQDKLRRISGAARALFHEQGFERTAIAQMAVRAGVAEGTLFLYVQKILAFTSELADAVGKGVPGRDPAAPVVRQLIGFFGTLLAYHTADPPLATAFMREVGFLRDPGRDYGFADIPMMPSLAAIVDRGKARGEIEPVLPNALLTQSVFAAYWYGLRNWANEEIDGDAFLALLEDLLRLQLRGLAPPGATAFADGASI